MCIKNGRYILAALVGLILLVGGCSSGDTKTDKPADAKGAKPVTGAEAKPGAPL